MKAYDIILKALVHEELGREFTATDFQKEPYFVGYEASARMSELAKMYPEFIIVGKKNRFRTITLDKEYVLKNFKEVKEVFKKHNVLL